MPEDNWSNWLDFNQEYFKDIPESAGVFMMHQAMKILFIGGSENIKKTIIELSTNDCIRKATRFKYRNEENFEKTRLELIGDFKKRHEGNLPDCMQ
ncbi:hypothetical protein [Nitrosopumilus sp.]|uniref:hypothetical protein n=1 Tax=Nitrosopumilus sp. TaxID=2024843 RepID=UPI002633A682|nr:hypothetical protein [Nitrosopumilus sp.]